eukprot:scaffold10.g2265.t1
MSEQQGLLPGPGRCGVFSSSGGGGGEPAGGPLAPPQPQRADCLLALCRTFNGIAAICALLCGLACGLALFLRSEAPTKDLFFYSGQALRLFGVAISCLAILVETEWRRFLRLVPALDFWGGRGVLQIFLATLTYREAYPRGESDLHKSLALYRSVASVSMLVVGFSYIFGAVLCIGAIKRARARTQEELAHAEEEYATIEARRKELERLLGHAP